MAAVCFKPRSAIGEIEDELLDTDDAEDTEKARGERPEVRIQDCSCPCRPRVPCPKILESIGHGRRGRHGEGKGDREESLG